MARRIEHRSEFPHDAATVYRTVVDREYLSKRLTELGGNDPAIVRHTASEDSASFALRHGIDGADLPPAVRTIVGGDLTIDREESWRRRPDGGYTGEVVVGVAGMPGELRGEQTLRDSGTGSVLTVAGNVSVPVPFVGGKVEETIGHHLRSLLDAEHEFTLRWLG